MATPSPNRPELVTRREAIMRVSGLLGGSALVGQAALLNACVSTREAPESGLFAARELTLLDEIADTILPETDTPGARAAGVGPFMALMVVDTYDAGEQRIFRDGLATLERESMSTLGTGFVSALAAERLELLERIDREQYDYMRSRRAEQPVHYFRMMKELALLGYFTSEIGYTQAMRYRETPGRFEPCVPYAPGDKIWAAHA